MNKKQTTIFFIFLLLSFQFFATKISCGENESLDPEELDSILLEAIRNKNIDEAIAALKSGANPNARNQYNNPLLFIACCMNNHNITEALLKAGANPNTPDENGYTPLQIVCVAPEKEYDKIFDLLLEYKADPEISSIADGTTPLELAILSLNTLRAASLMLHGAKVNDDNREIFLETLEEAKIWGNKSKRRKKYLIKKLIENPKEELLKYQKILFFNKTVPPKTNIPRYLLEKEFGHSLPQMNPSKKKRKHRKKTITKKKNKIKHTRKTVLQRKRSCRR